MTTLKYLSAYPPAILEQVKHLIATGGLGAHLDRKYPQRHAVQTDKALYAYVMDLKNTHMRGAQPLHKVEYDSKLDVVHHALGLNTRIARVQGGKLKSKKEIRIASLFKQAPPEFLRMIAVHELAHLRETEHDKAFYRLCVSMEPDYHQLEFDLRLYLTYRDSAGG